MGQSNLEQFNGLAKQILERLIEACPVAIELNVQDFGLQEGSPAGNGFWASSSDETFLNHSIKWLESEGYIRAVGGAYVATLVTLNHFQRVPNVLS
ncbi:hypothetical protein [Pseudomonas vranovensis]|uniref:hypothetical protein n=1 Tax=Pseudomonas vranovensis TaxID=321661 RepID=UPI003D97AA56